MLGCGISPKLPCPIFRILQVIISMKHAIIGTAGHVDHGKTALVKALTGIDCDRLKEEKERGLTIELGYAHLDLGNGKGASIMIT